MFNSSVQATPSLPLFSLMLIIETLLFVNLREELTGDDGAQPDGAYHYGL